MWATGYNYDGQLGTGNNTTLNTPALITNNVKAIAAGVNSSYAIKNDGSLWSTGNNQFGQLGIGNQQYRNVMTMVTNNVAAVSATYAHTLILKRMVLSMEQEPIAAIS